MGRLVWIVVCIVIPTAASADEVYKCVTADSISYQSIPCSAGQVEAKLPRLPAYADPPERDAARAPRAWPDTTTPTEDEPYAQRVTATWQSRRGFPYRSTIALGMTDDQVLNTPLWGRPSRIVRTRDRHAWQERWTYERASGMRQLSFTNGRLTSIDADVAQPTRLAGLSLR